MEFGLILLRARSDPILAPPPTSRLSPVCSLRQSSLPSRGVSPLSWSSETLVGNSFGTRQQRKLFPHFHPPNFLGNKFLPLRGAPHRGPGSYMADMHGLAYNLSKIPTSRKGYTFGARTAVRFKPINKDMTPYPGMYQTVTPREQKHKQNFAPFNTLLPRFRTCSKDTYDPGYVCLLFSGALQQRAIGKKIPRRGYIQSMPAK